MTAIVLACQAMNTGQNVRYLPNSAVTPDGITTSTINNAPEALPNSVINAIARTLRKLGYRNATTSAEIPAPMAPLPIA